VLAATSRWVPSVPVTNMRILKPSRQMIAPGDDFAIGLPDLTYVFGRVIAVELPRERAPMPRSNLIYVYRHRSPLKVPQLDRLIPDRLLLAPTFINRLPWSRGYFETVSRQPLTSADVLPAHCFRDWTGGFLDENGDPLPAERQPCGEWALASFQYVDRQLSDALGLPPTSPG
jgi:hypothetical protein